MLVNGLPNACIQAEDRGLSYGDGVFRTLRLCNGKPLYWQHHIEKLRHDCHALALSCPDEETLLAEIIQVAGLRPDAVVKIIVTRGCGQRGYAIPATGQSTRIVDCQPLPKYPPEYATSGIAVHRCRIKLGHQPMLAGIKHLNRLENVLAASECAEAGFPEGLLEDEAGAVVGGTRSNLFIVRNNTLATPDLSRCGVAGVQRKRALKFAHQHAIPCRIDHLRMDDLLTADEIFLVNSVFGLWPVREFPGYLRSEHPVADTMREWLNEDEA